MTTMTVGAVTRDVEVGEPIAFGPFSAAIEQDHCAENPWENWDCQTPVGYYTGRSNHLDVFDSGDEITDFFDRVTPAWVSRHWRRLCDILDVDIEGHQEDVAYLLANQGYGRSEARKTLFSECLRDLGSTHYSVTPKQFLTALEALYRLLKYPVLKATLSGYCQGDWGEALFVVTPEHAKRCGMPFPSPGDDMAASLASDANLLNAWLWGDTYGYAIKDEQGDVTDSCWGYFGAYWDGDDRFGAYVLRAAEGAIQWLASRKVAEFKDSERAARDAFIELRREVRDACSTDGAARLKAISKAIDRRAHELVDAWRNARQLRRSAQAILN